MAQQLKPSTKKWAATGSTVSMDTTKQNLGWVDEKPTYQKMNWLLQQITQHLMHINEYGIGVWDATTDYPVGGIATLNGIKYECLATPCVNQNPETQPAYWTTFGSTPAGAVMTFAQSTAPTGWLKCNGAAISRTTYARLFAAIGTTYGVGNGSTTFNVPELRAEFVRGLDDGRGVDVGRTIGSVQAEMIGPHTHVIGRQSRPSRGTPDAPDDLSLNDANVAHPVTSSSANVGTENRPRNIALLYCIKT